MLRRTITTIFQLRHNRNRAKPLYRQTSKSAATIGSKIQHGPFFIIIQRTTQEKQYMKQRITTIQFPNYPERRHFNEMTWKPTTHPLLERARTGHNRSRQHLNNIGMDESNICRHCDKYPETIEHQVLHCKLFRKQLKRSRLLYHSLTTQTFNSALWSHEKQMTKILRKAEKSGCFI